MTIYAVVPDGTRYCSSFVVDIEDLLARLADGEPYDEAVVNSGIDAFDDKDAKTHLVRVRDLNVSGDARAYWASAE